MDSAYCYTAKRWALDAGYFMFNIMHNFNHDLIQALSVKLDSLWRYDEYIKNAEGCDHCTNIWKELKEADLKAADKLREEIANHIQEGKFISCPQCFVEKEGEKREQHG